jgi:hypothetical protein
LVDCFANKENIQEDGMVKFCDCKKIGSCRLIGEMCFTFQLFGFLTFLAMLIKDYLTVYYHFNLTLPGHGLSLPASIIGIN